MSRAAAARSRRVSAKPAGPRLVAPPKLTLAHLRGLGHVVLWVGTLAGVIYGLHRLEPVAVRAQGDGRWRYEWASTPPWFDALPESVAAEVGGVLKYIEEKDLREEDLAARVHELLSNSSPYIAKVKSVRKRADGVILVDADFRRPLTGVDFAGVTYLIDEQGYRLPMEKPTDQRPIGDVYIEGVSARPPAYYGQQWPGAELQAAIKLVRLLHLQEMLSLRQHLFSVDVRGLRWTNERWRGQMKIHARDNLTIIWGLPPGDEYGVEATAQQKLAKLLAIFQRSNGQLYSGGTLDLTPLGAEDTTFEPATPRSNPRGAPRG